MATRLELHAIFKEMTEHVYFQPPPTMLFPCILYELAGDDAKHADDMLYSHKMQYEVTIIGKSPDSPIWDAVRALPYCTFDRRFPSENLYHDVFTLFF